MINSIHSNYKNGFVPETVTPAPAVRYFVITNYNAVRTGQTRQLQLSIPENFDITQLNTNMIAQLTLLGDTRKVQLHEKVTALDFNEIAFSNGSDIEISSIDDLEIIGQSKKKSVILQEDQKSNENGEPLQLRLATIFAKIYTNYSKFQQSFVKHFRNSREKEQVITSEDIRQRQIKNRDKKWNLRMDHWVKKEANRWEILKSLIR